MNTITNQHVLKQTATTLSPVKTTAQPTNANGLSAPKGQTDNFAMSLEAQIMYGSDTSTVPQPDRDIFGVTNQLNHWNRKFEVQTNINTSDSPLNVVVRGGNILISRTGGNAPEDFAPLTTDTDLSDLSQETLDKLNALIDMVEQNAHTFNILKSDEDVKAQFVSGLPKASVQFTPQLVDKQEVSRKFAQQRQHLIDTYEGDELNSKLAELNSNFEATIRESMKARFGFFTILSEDGEVLDYELLHHVEKQTDIFLTSFMDNIQHHDFGSAFKQSVQLVMESLGITDRVMNWDVIERQLNGNL